MLSCSSWAPLQIKLTIQHQLQWLLSWAKNYLCPLIVSNLQ